MSDTDKPQNPLVKTALDDPLVEARKRLDALREHWAEIGARPFPVPLVEADHERPHRDWYPQPEWMTGWDAFELFRLQSPPEQWAPPIARICQTISDQADREIRGANYVIGRRPPSHALLEDFEAGSNQWFRALYDLLTRGSDSIEGWEDLVSALYDWLGPYDSLRIQAYDVLLNALSTPWYVEHYSLPEAKQDPVWDFPRAMAWIATRDYLALARMGWFKRPSDEDEAVATDGVWHPSTETLGWLHSKISFSHCECGAFSEFGLESFKHCTCISIAWEHLVRFRGGLSPDTPELVFNIQEGWVSMTWPEGADDIRFLRRDILDRWPALAAVRPTRVTIEQSTTAGERDCRHWLLREFAADPERRRSKRDFRNAALAAFQGRLSERGFNLRVWPSLAREHGRDSAGAKKKS